MLRHSAQNLLKPFEQKVMIRLSVADPEFPLRGCAIVRQYSRNFHDFEKNWLLCPPPKQNLSMALTNGTSEIERNVSSCLDNYSHANTKSDEY